MSVREFHYRVLLPMTTTDSDHIEFWCEKHFGIRGIKWDCWFNNDSPFNYDLTFAFDRHEDAVLFTLTWQ